MFLRRIDTPRFLDIFSDMCTQFPQNELKKLERFKELLDSDLYFAYEINDGKIGVGYVLFAIINSYLWVDYIAIYKNYHSNGYGSAAINALKDMFANYKGCFLEVEKTDTNRPDTVRRADFYKRHGAKLTDCKYLYPNSDFALDMDLYYMPFSSGVPDKEDIKTLVRDVFSLIHSDLEHVNNVYSQIEF